MSELISLLAEKGQRGRIALLQRFWKPKTDFLGKILHIFYELGNWGLFDNTMFVENMLKKHQLSQF